LKQFHKNVSSTFFRQTLNAVLGLVTSILIARIFGPEGNGSYALSILIPTSLVTILNLGLGAANSYHLSSGKYTEYKIILANLKLYSILVGLGLFTGSVFLLLFAEKVFPGVESELLWLGLFSYPFVLSHAIILSLFQGIEDFSSYNKVAIAQPLIFLALFLLGIWGYQTELSVAITALLLSYFLTTISGVISLCKYKFQKENKYGAKNQVVKSLLKYGINSHLGNVFTYLNYKADIFLVNYFLGPLNAGLYVVAVSVVEKLWLPSQAISVVALPKLTRMNTAKEQIQHFTPLLSRVTLAITAIASILVLIITPVLIPLAFGEQFSESVMPIFLLLPGIIIFSSVKIIASDIAARGHPILNSYSSGLVLICNVILNIVLIPKFGLNGAAISTSAAYLIQWLFCAYFHARLSSNNISELFLIHRDDLTLVKDRYINQMKKFKSNDI
jgi:O-antigen/teichoic acid export membrane protein